ncbi:junctional adhesion molecule B-like isoform X1 [Carassius auratus]|uniref:Junctional adhesion molecule B-like isoform X1 n=1 Tax=Carassius auratus TaxID=7957 RepID=A0A6P6JLM7_CARAU|nr:junctional adhesion molecule B-like isoform X1 [Carassius auratus]
MFVSVALLVLIQSATVVPVTVTSRSPGVEVREFSDAVLSCEFSTENEKNPRIEWKKIDKHVALVYFESHFTESLQDRAEINGATVTLKKVTRSDAGTYRCEVSTPKDTITLGEINVTLTVLVPPHTPSCDVPSSALTGSLVQLRCRDHQSVPAAVYTWYKDNRALPIHQPNATYTIDEKTGVLMFQKVSRADTGQYHCEAKNRVGPGKSCSGTRMQIDDLNVAAVVSGVLLLVLLLCLCAFGVFYGRRHGFFSRQRGSPNTVYSHPPKEEPQDFKHTQSFML